MDIGLDHRSVHSHTAAFGHPVRLRDLHHPFVNLFDHLRPQSQAPAAHGLGIRHLGGAHTGEVAVHQIGPHLALQHRIAPVADVLENQEPQHHLGRRRQPASAAALGMPLRQRFVYGCHDVLILEHFISVLHPVFAKIVHLVGDQAVAKAQLHAPHLNHAFFLPGFGMAACRRSRS